MAMLHNTVHSPDNRALTPGLDQRQRASLGLKPHCVPVGLLLALYITRGQDTAEE